MPGHNSAGSPAKTREIPSQRRSIMATICPGLPLASSPERAPRPLSSASRSGRGAPACWGAATERGRGLPRLPRGADMTRVLERAVVLAATVVVGAGYVAEAAADVDAADVGE